MDKISNSGSQPVPPLSALPAASSGPASVRRDPLKWAVEQGDLGSVTAQLEPHGPLSIEDGMALLKTSYDKQTAVKTKGQTIRCAILKRMVNDNPGRGAAIKTRFEETLKDLATAYNDSNMLRKVDTLLAAVMPIPRELLPHIAES